MTVRDQFSLFVNANNANVVTFVGLQNGDNVQIGPSAFAFAAAYAFGLTNVNVTFAGSIAAYNLSGINTGNEDQVSIGLIIDGAASKATPVNADEIPIADSAASFVTKKLTWANLKATLKTYFDTLYQAVGTYVTSVTAVTPLVSSGGTTPALSLTPFKGTASGTNTYTVTLAPVPAAYVNGMTYTVTFTNANSGASTLNANTLGAKAIQYKGAALTGAEIPAGATVALMYDGTQFQIVGVIGGGGGSTPTGTGFVTVTAGVQDAAADSNDFYGLLAVLHSEMGGI